MFYQPELEEELRFGDVVKGFVFAVPQVNEPILSLDDEPNYSIDIALPRFSVVLTPCCSIDNKTISLSPLIQLRIKFFENPYFSEDFTKINQLVPPELALPPNTWKKIREEEKQRRIISGPEYQFLQLFVYAPSPEFPGLLPKYTLSRRDQKSETGFHQVETDYYMVDFANIHRINCDKINRGSPIPPNIKVLQLSVYTRKELRDKISAYYTRMPAEDEILLKS